MRPPDQVIEPWLRGTERFVLLNLHPGHPRLAGGLPGIMLGMTVNVPGETSSRVPLNLDGVHFDLREGEAKVTLTWRARVPLPEGLGARLTLAERARVAEGVDA